MDTHSLQRTAGRAAAAASARRTCLLLLLGGMAGGCNLLDDTHRVWFLAKRTTKLEPRFFAYQQDDRLTRRRDHAVAREVWAEISAENPTVCDQDYARGFIAGFSDYLYRGGTGQPPLVPPRGYWRVDQQSSAGRQAIDQWYAGFRHGAEECQARGYRELIVVPSSLVRRSAALEIPSARPSPIEELPPGAAEPAGDTDSPSGPSLEQIPPMEQMPPPAPISFWPARETGTVETGPVQIETEATPVGATEFWPPAPIQP